MDNEDLWPDIDPWDTLQEHNLLINRLIKAFNSQESLVTNLVKQNQTQGQMLELMDHKIHQLENTLERQQRLINQLNQIKTGPQIK